MIRLCFAFADSINISLKIHLFSPLQIKLGDIVPELTFLRRSRSPEVKKVLFVIYMRDNSWKTVKKTCLWNEINFQSLFLSFPYHNDNEIVLLIFLL